MRVVVLTHIHSVEADRGKSKSWATWTLRPSALQAGWNTDWLFTQCEWRPAVVQTEKNTFPLKL